MIKIQQIITAIAFLLSLLAQTNSYADYITTYEPIKIECSELPDAQDPATIYRGRNSQLSLKTIGIKEKNSDAILYTNDFYVSATCTKRGILWSDVHNMAEPGKILNCKKGEHIEIKLVYPTGEPGDYTYEGILTVTKTAPPSPTLKAPPSPVRIPSPLRHSRSISDLGPISPPPLSLHQYHQSQ